MQHYTTPESGWNPCFISYQNSGEHIFKFNSDYFELSYNSIIDNCDRRFKVFHAIKLGFFSILWSNLGLVFVANNSKKFKAYTSFKRFRIREPA